MVVTCGIKYNIYTDNYEPLQELAIVGEREGGVKHRAVDSARRPLGRRCGCNWLPIGVTFWQWTKRQASQNILHSSSSGRVVLVVVMVVGWGAIADEMELGMASKSADNWWQRMKYHLDKRPQGKHWAILSLGHTSLKIYFDVECKLLFYTVRCSIPHPTRIPSTHTQSINL